MAEEAKTETAEKKTCFVACPIDKPGSPVRRRTDNVIKMLVRPVLEPAYKVIPAHEDRRPGVITSQIVTRLIDSDIVVFDLTGPNANVMYELGIRNAYQKPVLLLCQEEQTLPFDIDKNRVVFYDYGHWDGYSQPLKELRAHLESAESEPDGASASPVTEARRDAAIMPETGSTPDDRMAQLGEALRDLRNEVRSNSRSGRQGAFIMPDRIGDVAPGDVDGAKEWIAERVRAFCPTQPATRTDWKTTKLHIWETLRGLGWDKESNGKALVYALGLAREPSGSLRGEADA